MDAVQKIGNAISWIAVGAAVGMIVGCPFACIAERHDDRVIKVTSPVSYNAWPPMGGSPGELHTMKVAAANVMFIATGCGMVGGLYFAIRRKRMLSI